MLKYHTYYRALAELKSTTLTEWRETFAGLAVLRLIDDWLDFGPSIVTDDALLRVRQVLDQITPEQTVYPIFQRIVNTIQQVERATVSSIQAPLLEYAQTLNNNAKFDLHIEVLENLTKRAHKANDASAIVTASLKLAYARRQSGLFDIAQETYASAIHHARKIGDITGVFRAQIGQAKLMIIRNEMSQAETLFKTLEKRATRLRDPQLLQFAYHDQAHLMCVCGDNEAAIPLLQRALKHHPLPDERYRIIADLASALNATGNIAAAWPINLELAVVAQEQWVRWQAVMNLMDISAKEGRKAQFELYHNALAVAPLDPWLALWFRGFSARGFNKFGDRARALHETRQAHSIAKAHKISINQIVDLGAISLEE